MSAPPRPPGTVAWLDLWIGEEDLVFTSPHRSTDAPSGTTSQ